jgi:hypothetical protein
MFRPSGKDKQLDMFASIPGVLKGTAYEQYNNEQSWHNMFREHVVNQIDESLFQSLFSQSMGAPNASIRVLVGMMALKEAFGWSDSDLFERCRFDLLVRSSLGLFNINDNLPTESTYYLLRKRIHDYNLTHEVNLIEQVFQGITHYQVREFNVSGRSVRMDSKLIGSNIAWCSRYELIHDTLGLFYKAIDHTQAYRLSDDFMRSLAEISQTPGNKIVYYSTREDIQDRLSTLGMLCYMILSVYQEHENRYYPILKRVFDDHFHKDDNDKIALKPKEEIQSDSLQSPFDPDSAYRNKDGQQVKGFSVNVTETCDEKSINLITDIQVSKANQADTEFVQPALEQTSMVLGHSPNDFHADGAFQSPDNVAYCQEEDINPYFNGIQGSKGQYDLELVDDQLIVTDTHTGEQIPSKRSKSRKWVIKVEKGYRYFSQKDIDACSQRKEIEMMPAELRKKRNNVEATIFQLSFHTRNNKTRYRGMIQTKMWAVLRCMWINLRRIIAFMENNSGRADYFCQIVTKKLTINQIIDQKTALGSILRWCLLTLKILQNNCLKLSIYKLHFS